MRFGSHLHYIELPSELITIPVLMELANKCQNLKFLTLDFSNAMQLHEFNDLNAFPCNLKNLTICLSEVIFLEGFMRKVYQSLSSVEVLHLVGKLPLSVWSLAGLVTHFFVSNFSVFRLKFDWLGGGFQLYCCPNSSVCV